MVLRADSAERLSNGVAWEEQSARETEWKATNSERTVVERLGVVRCSEEQ